MVDGSSSSNAEHINNKLSLYISHRVDWLINNNNNNNLFFYSACLLTFQCALQFYNIHNYLKYNTIIKGR